MSIKITENELPGLYQSANKSSIIEQRKYFSGIIAYLILLLGAAIFSFFCDDLKSPIYKIISAILFFLGLVVIVWQKFYKPEDIWYNGRAVAESVKTRSWRWMMRSEPYMQQEDSDSRKHFIQDMKSILQQNKSLVGKLGIDASIKDPVSQSMQDVRSLDLQERFELYKEERITDQALWYVRKSKFNKKWSFRLFLISIILHGLAIILLLLNIMLPTQKFPIEIIAVIASSILTWIQSKKYNELSSSYTLTAHEIVILKGEVVSINQEEDLSEYVMNCENAFSREHTQWVARKNE